MGSIPRWDLDKPSTDITNVDTCRDKAQCGSSQTGSWIWESSLRCHIQPFPTFLRSCIFTPAFSAQKKRPTSECCVTGCRPLTSIADQVIRTVKSGVLCVLSSKHRSESKAAARGFGREWSQVLLWTQYRFFWNRSEHNEWSSPTPFVRLMLCSLALVNTLPSCFRLCRVGAFPLPAVFLPLHDPRPTGWIPCPGVIPKAKSKACRVLPCRLFGHRRTYRPLLGCQRGLRNRQPGAFLVLTSDDKPRSGARPAHQAFTTAAVLPYGNLKRYRASGTGSGGGFTHFVDWFVRHS